jgi:toxin FitB
MIVYDTNVVSEFSKPGVDERVRTWHDMLPKRRIAITAVTIGELAYGIALRADGAKKRQLAVALEGLVNEDFKGRVLSFDLAAANYYGLIVAKRQAMAKPISHQDAQIAAICIARGATLATRDIKGFEGTGVELINPWDF